MFVISINLLILTVGCLAGYVGYQAGCHAERRRLRKS